jgi:hypothetical protein
VRQRVVQLAGQAVALAAGGELLQGGRVAGAIAGDAAGQCPRYDALVRRLTEAAGTLDSRAALGLLRAVAQTESATQWSVVYGMNTGQVEVVVGRRHDQVHTFRLAQDWGSP